MSQRKPRRPPKASEDSSDGSEGTTEREVVGSGDDGDEESSGFLGGEPHWGRVYNPGKITVGDPQHRRLIEETGNDDNGRVEFVGDAAGAESGEDINKPEGDNNG